MFKILELKNTESALPTEVGYGYNTREQALAAVKKHLTTFKISGRNPEGDYWWVRDSEGLRKCWISSVDRRRHCGQCSISRTKAESLIKRDVRSGSGDTTVRWSGQAQ